MARPRKFDEQGVLLAAREQFWRNGYDGTSVHDLGKATGLGNQSIYGAFGNKRALFLRVLEDYCTAQVAGLGSSLSTSEDPWQSLLDAVTFEDSGRMSLTEEGCLLANCTAALSRRDETVQQHSVDTYSKIRDLFATQVVRAQNFRLLDDAIDPENAALSLLTVMQGIEFMSKSGIDREELERVKAAAIELLVRAYSRVEAPPQDAD
ncbi:hypothetical protein AXA44_37065 [Rhodococcus sp. SC4]|nr:hypothetical protein AXA44_37065 [Rhodococcus sp. SC4]